MSRPAYVVAIVGTGTEVGKTWVAEQLLRDAKSRGYSVAARKPVQSFDAESTEPSDAERLACVTDELLETICPAHRSYPLAMAPPMAADMLQRPPIVLTELLKEIQWPPGMDLALLETVGGLCSPIAHDGDTIDFVRRSAPDETLLVADAELGTLNTIGLCLHLLQEMRVTVFLNRFDENNVLHHLNRQWLQEHRGIDPLTHTDAWWERHPHFANTPLPPGEGMG